VRGKAGELVAGASLLVEGSAREPVVTNDLGQYRLSAIARGDLRVRVTPPGGKARTITLSVPAASYDIILD
jgi:Carboxypeptidase regulatory-like domain